MGAPVLGSLVVEGVVRVRRRHKRLDRNEHSPDLKRRTPLVLEDVEADPPESVHVRVVDLRDEAHLML